ncbi:MAG TPA: cation:dicarboxylase symporter family transporter [Herbaspirillum sp.]|jgi:aerobic C4-dicarboxylate transport protein
MIKKLSKSAIAQMILAIAVGILLGHFWPSAGIEMKPLSDGFVRLIGMLIGVLMFCLVVAGIAGMQDKMQAAKVGVKTIIYFEAMTAISLAAGILAAYLLQPGKGLQLDLAADAAEAAALHLPRIAAAPAVDGGSVAAFLLNIIPDSFSGAFLHNSNLQILLLAVLCGVALARLGQRGRALLALTENVLQVLYGMINIILKVAPLAAFGAVAFTIGKYGVGSILPLLRFVADIYLASILFVVLLMAAVMCFAVRVAGCNIFRLLGYIKEEISLVFFTTSSMAALPGLIAKMERLGCAKPVVRLVLPTGYTFNLNGTNIYIAMGAMFLAQAAHVDLSPWQMLSLLAIGMLTSKGATSITGSGFIALAATLASLQIVPVAGIVLLLGVERLMKCRSLTNMIGNCLACIVISAWENALDRDRMRSELSGRAQGAPGMGAGTAAGGKAAAGADVAPTVADEI